MKWKVSHTSTKQSNYGRYKAGIHCGEGRELKIVTITADTPELAMEVAKAAADAMNNQFSDQ